MKIRIFLKRILFTTVLLIATAVIGTISVVFILHFLSDSNEYRAARAENDSLREIAAVAENEIPLGSELPSESGEYTVARLSALDIEMLQINPDYVCWIKIDGTRIDHPVVRGQNNDTYINTSFYGEPNSLGSLFMDFRNRGDNLSNILIYGHNSVQGEMFGDLHLFLNESFLSENRIITLTVNGNTFEYEIFSVRQTDVFDPAYTMYFFSMNDFYNFAFDIDAPVHATKIITLSTCVTGGGNDDRLIVQAYARTNTVHPYILW